MKNGELQNTVLSEKEIEMVTGGAPNEATVLGRVNSCLAARKGGAGLMGSVTDDLGEDSLVIVDIVNAIEDEFRIQIPPEDFVNFKSPKSITEYLEKRLNP